MDKQTERVISPNIRITSGSTGRATSNFLVLGGPGAPVNRSVSCLVEGEDLTLQQRWS